MLQLGLENNHNLYFFLKYKLHIFNKRNINSIIFSTVISPQGVGDYSPPQILHNISLENNGIMYRCVLHAFEFWVVILQDCSDI